MSSANTTNGVVNEIRNLTGVLHDMKDEAQRFVQTRISLLKSELQQKLPNLKIAIGLGVIGSLLLITAYFLFTLALVAIAVVLFNESDYRWVFALLSVGILWSLLGGIAVYFAKREFALKGLVPRRTFEVLKGDKIWLEREAKSQI